MLKEKDYVNFEKLMQKINQYAKVSQENKEIAKKWLIVAKQDIDISQILFEMGFIAGSVYHLEQAYEKLLKSFYLFSGKETSETIFGHDFVVRVLKRETSSRDDLDLILDLINSLEDKKHSLEDSKKGLEKLTQDEKGLGKISREEINFLLNLIDTLDKALKSKDSLKKLTKKIGDRKTKRNIKQFLLHLIGRGIRKIPLEEYTKEDYLKDKIDYILVGMKLYILSLITFPHWNAPRYPMKISEVDFFSYNKHLGIVNCIEVLIKEFEKIVVIIEKEEGVKNDN